ncbi:MAG: ABC transporter permease [Lachnospiraceae bacterium]|nr:ABC transporter permease [Lachnospiraceae bacterium]
MEYIKSAFLNIKQNKGRTFLTMLGIIIGISSVITILSIGNGMRTTLNKSLDSITNGAIPISIDNKNTNKYLTYDDIRLIKDSVPLIKGVSVKMYSNGTAHLRNNIFVYLNGSTPDSYNNLKDGLAQGRYYTESELESASAVCVISEQSAIFLFGSVNVLGMTVPVDFNNVSGEFTIIGIARSTEKEIQDARSLLSEGYIDFTYADLYVPYTVMTQRLLLTEDKITSFDIYPVQGKADEAALKAKAVAETILDLRGKNAVKIQSFASFADMYSKILNAVTGVIAFIAAISLLVGGIGVMNIMTVTVTERTREIGIRKSLGARTSSIMLQFLTESATITLLGGIIGMIFGYIFSRIVGMVADITPVILPNDVILVVSISTAIGIFFGMYPARKAAKLNPIDALRTE